MKTTANTPTDAQERLDAAVLFCDKLERSGYKAVHFSALATAARLHAKWLREAEAVKKRNEKKLAADVSKHPVSGVGGESTTHKGGPWSGGPR